MEVSDSTMTVVSFIIIFLLDGVQKVSGIFFFKFVVWLKCSRQTAAFPFFLSVAVADIAGPFAKRICRGRNSTTVVVWGCILCAVGAGLCFCTTDAVWFSIYWGAVFGFGHGMTSPLLISQFAKHYHTTFHSGLFLAAPSIGCLILSIFMFRFVQLYGINGSFIILSGVILNCVPLMLVAIFKIGTCSKRLNFRRKSGEYRISKILTGAPHNSYQPKGIKGFESESIRVSMEPNSVPKNIDSKFSNGIYSISSNESTLTAGTHPESDLSSTNECYASSPTESTMEGSSKSASCFNEKTSDSCTESVLGDEKDIENEKEDIQTNSRKRSMTFSEKKCTEIEKLPELIIGVLKENDHEKFSDNKDNQCDYIKMDITSGENVTILEENLPVEKRIEGSVTEKLHKKSSSEVIETAVEIEEHIAKKSENMVQRNSDETEIDENLKKDKRSNTVIASPVILPFEIKVHVVECTFNCDEQYLERFLKNGYRKGNRNHTNSMTSSCYENIDFAQLFLNSDKPHPPCSVCCDQIEEDENKGCKGVFLKIFHPSHFILICASVISRASFVTLLIIFSDLAAGIGIDARTAISVLVAFGSGGVVGNLSLAYWGGKIYQDGTNSAGAIMFMLNGLAIAGVLWSMNIYMLVGFYALLGFLEVGLKKTLTRLLGCYVNIGSEDFISWTSKYLGGILLLCIPYVIGLTKDVSGDFDDLLQVVSCLSVFCALLCYFLPKFARMSIPSGLCRHF